MELVELVGATATASPVLSMRKGRGFGGAGVGVDTSRKNKSFRDAFIAHKPLAQYRLRLLLAVMDSGVRPLVAQAARRVASPSIT